MLPLLRINELDLGTPYRQAGIEACHHPMGHDRLRNLKAATDGQR